jgi:CHAT domain-containing protein/Tfp pilus assembly protein PilF
MTARTSSYLLPAILTVGLALLCVCPAQAGGTLNQSLEPATIAGSLQKQEANELNKRGIALRNANDLDKALEAFNRALELFRQADDLEGEANALANIGLVYLSKQDWSTARDYCTQALNFFRMKKDPAAEADLLLKIAFTFHREKNYHASVNYYRQAALLQQATGNPTGEATALLGLGMDLSTIGEKQAAIDLLVNALPRFRGSIRPDNEALVLRLIALIYNELGRNQEALSYYEKTLAAWEAAGERAQEAEALIMMGGIEMNLGNPEQALRHYTKSLTIWRGLKDLQSGARQVELLGLMGSFYESISDLRKALSYYDEALSLSQSLNDDAGKATALDNMGRVSNYRDEYAQAMTFFEKSLALWRSLNNVAGEAQTLSLMGNACHWAGDYQRAAAYLNQSLALCQGVQDYAAEAEVLGKLGMVYAKMIILRIPFQNSSEIQGYIDQALKRIQAVAYPAQRLRMLGGIGLIYALLGNMERSLEIHQQALRLAEDSRDEEGKASALFHIGYVYEMQNQPQQALKFYDRSIEIRDKMRASVHLEEIKTGLSTSPVDTYKYAAALRMQIGEPVRAFELSERARARTLLDQLANVRPKAKQKASAGLRQEEQALRSELYSLEKKRDLEISKTSSSFDQAIVGSIQNQLDRKRSDYENLLVRLKLDDPEYASLRTVAPLSLSEVQALISKDTTLISYFVTNEQTLIFIVTRDSFQAVKVEVTEAELKREVEGFRQFPTLSDSAPVEMKRLHKQLIAPVSKYVKTPIAAIIPHGVLNYLPFAALTDGRRYFGEEHVVYYLPSANVLPFIQKASRQTQKQPAGNPIMVIAQSRVVGLPPLLYADEEAGAVANLFHTTTLGKVSKATFLKQSGDYSILHIAAHGELDSVNPLFSRIWLAPDDSDGGALTVHEVYDMDLQKTSMVVLSACETQLGAQSKGDDITGLNRAFIYAGTPTVVASLWTVDDQATGLLMRSFYTHLRSGMGKAEALRAAQSEMRQRYPNPYYWAAFVLTGDAGPANRFASTPQRSASTHR